MVKHGPDKTESQVRFLVRPKTPKSAQLGGFLVNGKCKRQLKSPAFICRSDRLMDKGFFESVGFIARSNRQMVTTLFRYLSQNVVKRFTRITKSGIFGDFLLKFRQILAKNSKIFVNSV